MMDETRSLSNRSDEGIEELIHRLKSLGVFHALPKTVLHGMASVVEHIILPKDTLLFKQGEDGVFWYIVFSGSLDIRVSDSGDLAKAESVCSLSSGSTLGESVLFGGPRKASVITQQTTQLFAISAENLKLLYGKYVKEMEGLFKSINVDNSDGLVGENSENEQFDGRVTPRLSRASHFGSPTSSYQNVKDTQLVLAGFNLYQLIKEHFPTLLKECTFNLRSYPDCCSGKDLVNWVVLNSSIERSRNMVVGMWQALLDTGAIKHVHHLQQFKDDSALFYHFSICPPSSETSSLLHGSIDSTSSGRGSLEVPSSRIKSTFSLNSLLSSGSSLSTDSLSSQLDEIFDILEQCAPESLTYAAFMKRPGERTEQDILIIFEEILHVKAFSQMSHAIKRELAGRIAYDSYHGKPGHMLFKQGDVGTSWYIILKGSVNVIVNGKGIVCTLHEGDDFGKLALVNDAPRAASIQLRDEHCSFLRIDKDDFNRILHSVEANTVRFREYGRDVLVLEKGQNERYSVVSGTSEKMLEHLMDCAMKDSASEDPFFYEFFLTHSIFISVERICSILLSAYKGNWQQGGNTETRIVIVTEDGMEQVDSEDVDGTSDETRKKVVKLVVKWIQVMGQDIVTEPAFDKLFRQLTASLVKDNLLESLDTLNKAFVNSYLSRRGTAAVLGKATNSSKTLYRKSLTGVGASLPVVPAALPTDEETVTVHTLERKSVQFAVQLGTPSESVLETACQRLHLSACTMDLCELTSSGEYKTIKPNVLAVQSTIDYNSCLFILPKGFSEKLSPLPEQNVLPSIEEHNFLERESSKDVACHLTVYDFELLSNVSRTEFIYRIFGRHKFGKITTNLDLLLRRFNEVQYWVVSEICRTSSLQSRVRVVCKFIKIADHCKSANNLNSFFAIVFGLMNTAVTRLKSTWEKVPPKLKKKLDAFEALANPSRNHRSLRMYQGNLKPPVVPFLPLVMKDVAFIHEGNETFVNDGLINFEKMRMLSSRIRGVEHFRSHRIDDGIVSTTIRTPHIREYIAHLKVMNNQKLLTHKSKSLE